MPLNTPDQSPEPGGARDLSSLFQVMISKSDAQNRILEEQAATLRAIFDMTRLTMVGGAHQEAAGHVTGMQYQQQMRPEILRSLSRGAGMPHDVTMGMTRMSGLQAMTSVQNLQAFGAQWLGERIAGGRLPGMGRLPDWMTTPRPLKEPKPSKLYESHDPHDATAEKPQPGAPATAQPGGQLNTGMAAQIQQNAQQAGDISRIAASETEAATKGAVEGALEEDRAGLGGVVQAATAEAGKRLRPGRPEVPLPPETAGGVEQGATGPSSVYQTAPAPGAPGPPSGGPPGSGGGRGDGGGTGGAQPPSGGGGGEGPAMAPSLMQNIGARVAMSGGTTGGFMGLLKKIPGVGLVVDALDKGAEFYQNQREAGRVFQESEGGTNLGAQTERLHSLAYQASMFGRVPEGVAAQMFGDVTALGYSQRAVGQGQQLQNRQSALNFLYHQYNATGMNVDQGAAILDTASKNATVSLGAVSDALSSLSDVAGKAGTNAIQARNNFNSYFQVALSGAVPGPGAPQLAGIFATQQAQMGNKFANVSLAGQMKPGEQYMLAGQTGMAPNQIQALERQNPAGYAQMVAGSVLQFIQQLPGMTPAMVADLQNMIQQAGGANVATTPALQDQVANQFLNKYQGSTPGMDLNVWAQFMGQVTNVPGLNAGNVMQYIVKQVAGANTPAALRAGAPGSSGGIGGNSTGGAGGSVSAQAAAAHGAGGAATGKYGLAQPVGATGTLGHIVHGFLGLIPGAGAMYHEHGSQTWQQVLGGSQAAQTYLGQEKKTGQRNPVLEALLQNVPKDAQVAVQTKNGSRVMSFADAMKYYPDEMEAGNVQFYDKSGKNLGTTGNFTQGLLDPAAQQGSAAEAAGTAGANVGQSLQQFQKQHGITPSAAAISRGGGGGNMTVDLTNEAKQLLKLLPSNSDSAAAAATVPSNPNVSSTSR